MNKNDAGSSTRGVDEKLDTLKETVKGLVEQGAQKVEEIKTKADRAITRGSDMLARVTEMIKAHPLKSVALAFGAGFIGMRLLRRRLTSSR